MSPLERYKPSEPDVPRQKKPEESLSKIRSVEAQEFLATIAARRKRQSRLIISRVASETKAEINAENEAKKTKGDFKELVAKRREARLERYKDKAQADKAFEQIVDYHLNRENFGSSGGWREQYLMVDANGNAPKDKMPLEAFVLEQQYAELEAIRDALIEVKISSSIGKIYPGLEGENTDKRKEKTQEKKTLSVKYFTDNKDQLEEYFSLDLEKRTEKRQKLLDEFQSDVFGDLNSTDKNQLTAVGQLFQALLKDYENMLDAQNSVWKLNDTMVANLTNENLTEEEWLDALAKKAEEEAKKLEEERKQQELQKTVQSNGTPSTVDFSSQYFSSPISAGEKLASNTEIKIDLMDPATGTYRVKFPQQTGEGMITDFQARQVIGEDGKPRNVFIFNDSLLPHAEVVNDSSFKSEINVLYLRHVISESVKQGKDYLGPDLGSMMSADEISFIAGNIFYPGEPSKMNDISMTTEQAKIFRNLVLLITNSSNNTLNNGRGQSPYGNLMAVGNRIKLLTYAVNPANGANKHRDKWLNFLRGAGENVIRNTNLESFCINYMGIEANNGNFTKKVE